MIAMRPSTMLDEVDGTQQKLQATDRSTKLAADFSIILCSLTMLINAAVAVFDPVSPMMILPQLRKFVPTLSHLSFAVLFDSAWFLAYALPVVLSVLVYRFSKNHHALGGNNIKYSPINAVLAFYIPFLNLTMPGEVVAELCSASQSSPSSDLRRWQLAWIIVVITICAYFFSTEFVFWIPGVNTSSAVAIETAFWIPIQIGFAFFLATTIKMIRLLRNAPGTDSRVSPIPCPVAADLMSS